MGTLLNRGGLVAAQNRYLLVRDKTSGVLRTSPWWLASTSLGTMFFAPRRVVKWDSPNYNPTPHPGPYGRSACHAGVLSAFPDVPWSSTGIEDITAYWSGSDYTGFTNSTGWASVDAHFFNTGYWAGRRLLKLRYVCSQLVSDAGAGAARIGVRTNSNTTLGTSLAWLDGDVTFTLPSVGTHTFDTDMILDNYLVICRFINNLAPPTEPFVYPIYHRALFQGHLLGLYLE